MSGETDTTVSQVKMEAEQQASKEGGGRGGCQHFTGRLLPDCVDLGL